jgi:NAD(P)-dependent dehydrogenase (short-subunit alcohol dehydrogenase family)
MDIDNNSIDLNSVEQILDRIIEYAHLNNCFSLRELKNNNPNLEKIISKCCTIANIHKNEKNKYKEIMKNNKKRKIKKENNMYLDNCYICKKQIECNNADNNADNNVDNNADNNLNNKKRIRMCNLCVDLNSLKRNITANMEGKISIVTGGRTKIGFEIVIKLLESGSTVIITTRFPANAVDRYKSHSNYDKFKDRLIIYALDLGYKKDIDEFVKYIYNNFQKIDVLINNAAQTLRRPKEFYNHLLSTELNTFLRIDYSNDATNANYNDRIVITEPIKLFMNKVFDPLQSSDVLLFPEGKYDKNNEQVDLRESNTWTEQLGTIDLTECAELFSINTLAPFHLIQCFKRLLENANGSYIVNVSSMEGVFGAKFKSVNHPHTNMAKAAFNMLTKTSADQFAKLNIYMVSVDTGWVTNEFPHKYRSEKFSHHDKVPLDNLDGACRVLDPVFSYYNGNNPVYGVFLKDYNISNW